MKKILTGFIFTTLWLALFSASGQAQDISTKIEQAKNYFWAARFDSAYALLNDVISQAKGHELHDAHLYMGFWASRQNKPQETVKQHFVNAVKASPRRKLNMDNLPPDLKEPYLAEKARLIGCVRLITEPVGAEYLAIGEQITSVTPDTICGLAEEQFEVMILMKGYHEVVVTIDPQPGELQTQTVTLNAVVQKSEQKWWLWATIGGVVATSTALLVTGGDSGGSNKSTNGLPTPPTHPSN